MTGEVKGLLGRVKVRAGGEEEEGIRGEGERRGRTEQRRAAVRNSSDRL